MMLLCAESQAIGLEKPTHASDPDPLANRRGSDLGSREVFFCVSLLNIGPNLRHADAYGLALPSVSLRVKLHWALLTCFFPEAGDELRAAPAVSFVNGLRFPEISDRTAFAFEFAFEMLRVSEFHHGPPLPSLPSQATLRGAVGMMSAMARR